MTPTAITSTARDDEEHETRRLVADPTALARQRGSGPPTAELPSLHVPDEPVVAQRRWLAQVLDGADLLEVLEAADGLVDWLWDRWRVLAQVGVDRQRLGSFVAAYRREVWLWLVGERTWDQCCAGLVGRIGRRTALDRPA